MPCDRHMAATCILLTWVYSCRPGHTQLAAHAGLLVAAEGAEIGKDMVIVDPHGAGADAAGHALGPGGVGGKYSASQAVDGIIGDGHRLFVAVVFYDADDRAEDLLLRDAHLVVHVGKDGGGIVIARP